MAIRALWFRNSHRAMLAAVAILGCGESSSYREASSRRLIAAEIAGCYEFTNSAGQPAGSQSSFWHAPVYLDTLPAPFFNDEGARASVFSMRPTRKTLDSLTVDASMAATWRIQAPDTLIVARSMEHLAQSFRLTPNGRDFAGTGTGVGGPLVGPPYGPAAARDSVFARRVACPEDQQPSRPSA